MENVSVEVLFAILTFLILLSAFFAASETGLMTLNRYRLKHLSKTHAGAKQASILLKRPDRLLGVLLLGNNFANIFASALTTIITVRLVGNVGVIFSSILLTIVVLIFGEVSPKTVAVLHPEAVAFPSAFVLRILLWVLYPIVWLINFLSNGLLRLFGVKIAHDQTTPLSQEELRTLVHETSGHIPNQHRAMLLSILDLEKVSVEDIMVPRSEIIGIDLENEWDAIVGQLANCQHTFLPIYKQNLDNIVGILHLRNALNLMASEDFDLDALKKSLEDAYLT